MAITDRPHRSVIAVVDDDPGLLESFESLLKSADYEVRLFSSGAALLESGGLREIDCLISDVAMPTMDGIELARAVLKERPGLPIVFVTGRPDLLGRSRLDRLDLYRVFKKPFDGQEVLAALALMLALRR